MTGNTKVICGRKVQHGRIIGGATATVAAETIHGQSLVARIDHFFTDRMGGVGFPFVTLPAKFDAGVFFEQQNPIRRMGGMAGCAFAFFDGFAKIRKVRVNSSGLLQLHRVCVTLTAGDFGGLSNQFFVPSGMRIVTRQTAAYIEHGPVNSVFLQHFPNSFFMALPAQINPSILGCRCQRPIRFLVAIVAGFLHQRFMGHIVNQSALIGAVRVVT